MKTKNKLMIGIVVLAVGVVSLGTCNYINAKEDDTHYKYVVQSSVDDYKSYQVMNEFFNGCTDTIKNKVDIKIEEIKKQEELKRIEQEKIEMERVKTERIQNIYGINNISSEKKISIVGVGYPKFDGSKFGVYADKAENLYNLIINGNINDISIEGFATIQDARNFYAVFYENYGLRVNEYATLPSGLMACNYANKEFVLVRNYRKSLNTINNIIGEIVSTDMNEAEAINAISQWIINKTSYRLDTPSCISLLENGIGNCNAYATTFKLMCDAVGIPCDFVVGDAGGAHGWNRVLLNGNWYYVDLTFADTSGNDSYLISSGLWNSHAFKKIDNKFIFN